MKKKIVKSGAFRGKVSLVTKSLAILLSITTVFTSGITASATELSNEDSTEYNTLLDAIDEVTKEDQEVTTVSNIEDLDVSDTIKDNDSVFKSCRLIIYSEEEMTFEENSFEDNIKSVQRFDNFYVVEYASIENTEEAYNLYKYFGYEVEVDEVKDAPEVVEDKDNDGEEVNSEKIASTNTKDNKNEEKIDDVNVKNNAEKKIITVAVLDTGLNKGEEIFDGKIVEGKDFTNNENTDSLSSTDNKLSSTPEDKNGHGTAMSRVILSNVDNNDKAEIKIMPIKVLNDEGRGTTLSAYKGIKYAIEKNVDVINLSMAGIGHSKLLENAINDAVNHNIPVVVSAGNNNSEITEYTPANIESAITISSADEIINKNGTFTYEKAAYSNYGSATNSIDFSTSGHFDYTRIINNKEVTTSIDGTSVSTAYVTSFVALLKQLALSDEDDTNNDLTFNDVYKSLNDSAIKDTNTIDFGNGYLKRENLLPKQSDEEQNILPVEDVEEIDEGIELKTTVATAGIKDIGGGQYQFWSGDGFTESVSGTNNGTWALLTILSGLSDKTADNIKQVRLDFYTDVTCNNIDVAIGIDNTGKELTIQGNDHTLTLNGNGT